MDDRLRNRTYRIIQSLDGLRRQVSWYLCRLTAQLAESEVAVDITLVEDLINSSSDFTSSILSTRYRILRTFFIANPGLPLEEAERDHDPTGQLIFAPRTR